MGSRVMSYDDEAKRKLKRVGRALMWLLKQLRCGAVNFSTFHTQDYT